MIQARLTSLAAGLVLGLSLGVVRTEATANDKPAPSSVTNSQPHATCLPPFWAGLLAGSSTEREVKQLLGDGYSTDRHGESVRLYTCLLYTSDAADERSSVDLGGRR